MTERMDSLKKMGLRKCVVALAAFLGLSGTAVVFGEQADAQETVPVQILGINDFHGALSTTGSYYGAGGAKVSNTGTAALLSSYFTQAENNFKTANPNGQSLRVQAGDMVGASPANSGLLQDQPTMRVLQQMKFNIGTLGNHEFDEGLGEFNRILTGSKPSKDAGFYDIVYQYNDAYTQDQLKGNFDLVIANVRNKADNSIPFGWNPYEIVTVGEGDNQVKIGVIGVVTQEIPNLVLAEHHKDYNFTDPATEIAKYAAVIRDQEKVNAIVVLGHTPSVQEGEDGVSGETADIMNKVNSIDPNNSVDAFFAGHNHVYTDGVVGNTRVVQSTSQGKGYIDLQGTYDKETQDFVSIPEATVNPVRPSDDTYTAPAPDAEVKAIVDDADTRVKAVTEEKIGEAAKPEDITRTVNELGESPAGNLITDGQVYMANKAGIGADFAMTNNGGIRADLKVGTDGSITWGSAQAVQPFGNIMQIVEMTGEQIKTVLNQQTFTYDKEAQRYNGYFLQVSGMKYTITDNPNKEDTDHLYVVDGLTKSDGTAIDLAKTYKVVINDFLFGGGDGFSEFTNAKLVGAMDPDTETFINYIKELTANGQKISASAENRKTYKTAEEIAKEESERIKTETKINELHADDQLLTGKTIPNADIVVSVKGLKNSVFGKADSTGDFKIDISSLKLTAGQTLVIAISGVKGGEADFTTEVLVPVVEKAKLQKLYDDEKSTNRKANEYTADTWNMYKKAVDDAKIILDKADATQLEVDQAYTTLDSAIKNLKTKEAAEYENAINKLFEAITQAENTFKDKEKEYTSSSWKVYQKALENAKKVLDDSNSSTEQLEKALNDLQSAIKGLKKLDTVNNQGGGTTPSSSTKKTYPSSSGKKTTTSTTGKSYPKTGAVQSLFPMGLGASFLAAAGLLYKKRKELEEK